MTRKDYSDIASVLGRVPELSQRSCLILDFAQTQIGKERFDYREFSLEVHNAAREHYGEAAFVLTKDAT